MDTARAYLAAAMDDWLKEIVLLRVPHKHAKEYGLSWTKEVLPHEEHLFGGLVREDENGCRTVPVTSKRQFTIQYVVGIS